MLLAAAAMMGIGSSIFHPEASRVARMASGGRHGFAQSLFQVGGNFGSAIGPLLAAVIVLARGQSSVAWFSLVALAGMMLLTRVGFWYRDHQRERKKANIAPPVQTLPHKVVVRSILILAVLIFSKFFYMAALTSYYTFYLIETFNVSVKDSQLYLFVFLAAVAAGTIAGGPIGDRFGRKYVIWGSILGAAPFTLALPLSFHAVVPASAARTHSSYLRLPSFEISAPPRAPNGPRAWLRPLFVAAPPTEAPTFQAPPLVRESGSA